MAVTQRRRRRKRGRPRRKRRGGLAFALLKGLGVLLVGSLLLVAPWRFVDPPTTAFIVREALAGESGAVRRSWRPLAEISPSLLLCVLAAEDQKFPSHNGFDVKAILTALDEPADRRRGASTITQQVAKNLYLWPGRSWFRKGIEAYLTLWIEALWPKGRILEIYLNVAEFGPGVFGADAGSRWAFRRPPSRLGFREAALLAAVLPNPKTLSAATPSNYVRERAAAIEAAARGMGKKILEDLDVSSRGPRTGP